MSCPLREGVEAEQGDGVGVDADADDRHTDKVHREARLHHVAGLHRAVTEHDRVGGRGHREGEGVGAGDPRGQGQVYRVNAECDGHLRQDRHEDISRRGVRGDVGDGHCHHRDDKVDDVVPMGSFDFDHDVDKEKIARYVLFYSYS